MQQGFQCNTYFPLSAGNAHLNHTTHLSSAGKVFYHYFTTELPLASTPFLTYRVQGEINGMLASG